ncbi:MAG: nucleotide exchange factor GrpE, partial [Bacteroidia bacterium]|nr:nucleotide exchange factor GrpE [Bacteroidia bacterium]
DNFRKRTRQEKEDIRKFANEEFLKTLLSSLDDLGRGIRVIEKSDDIVSIKEGIVLIEKNLWHNLQKQGVEVIEAIGLPFNSDFHEAITTVPSQEGVAKGTIVDEVEKGYLYQGKVIRYSKVIIAE